MLRVALSPATLLGASGIGLQGSILQFGNKCRAPQWPSHGAPVELSPESDHSGTILVGGLNNMLHQAAGNLPFKLSQLGRLT